MMRYSVQLRDCVNIIDDALGTWNTNSQIKFKTSILRSSLFDYFDAYVLVSGTKAVAEVAAGRENNNIQVVFKNCAPFTDWVSKVSNTQIHNAKEIDLVIAIHSLIENCDNYSEILGSLCQYYRDEPALTDVSALDNVPDNSALFKYKQIITGSTGNDSTKVVKIMVQLHYLSKFWRTRNMPLTACEINLILTCSVNCAICNAATISATRFVITNTKLYVLVVTLSTQDDAKLLEQLKSGFKRTFNWNKC